jgi:DNA-binding CsgD family transcriptional regulator
LDALLEAGLDAAELRRRLRPLLRAALPFDAYCVNTADPIALTVTSSIGDGLDAAQAERLFAIEHRGGDFNTLRALAVGPRRAASLHAASGGRPEQSERMREIFLPLGYADELRAALVEHGFCWGWLHLYRRGEVFAPAEVGFIESLSAPLGRALRRAAFAALLESESGGDPELLLFEEAARRLALDAVPGSGEAVPHLALDLVADGAACVLDPDGRRVAVQRLDGRLLLTRPPPERFAALLFAAAGLTPREREVARALVRGRSNEAIARSLDLSLYTAKDHVKAVLAKLGAESRTDCLLS